MIVTIKKPNNKICGISAFLRLFLNILVPGKQIKTWNIFIFHAYGHFRIDQSK